MNSRKRGWRKQEGESQQQNNSRKLYGTERHTFLVPDNMGEENRARNTFVKDHNPVEDSTSFQRGKIKSHAQE